jgi:hypothetical protein
LDEIKQSAGYAYKEVEAVDMAGYKEFPSWCCAHVEIGYNNDPESVAHEVAHGLHEMIRARGKPDRFGEEFADAIRYYVEDEMKTNSKWLLKEFNKAANPFTSRYGQREQFITALKSGELFGAVGWT